MTPKPIGQTDLASPLVNFEYKELDRYHLCRITSRALAGNAQVPSSPPGAPAPSLPIDIGNSNVRRQADLQ